MRHPVDNQGKVSIMATEQTEKPELVLADTRKMTFADTLAMFRRLTGREPTAEDTAEARKLWDEAKR